MTIEAHSNLRAYFRDSVTSALARRRVDADATTEFYLVELLSRYVSVGAGEVERPLVMRLAEATEASDPRTRLRLFRAMGDAALVTCGFFSEQLERRGVTREYFVAMGEQAYTRAGRLAGWVGAGEGVFGEVFGALSARFAEYAWVLDEVRESTVFATPKDVVRLYERFRKTGSPTVAERLRREGVFPSLLDGEVTLH